MWSRLKEINRIPKTATVRPRYVVFGESDKYIFNDYALAKDLAITLETYVYDRWGLPS